MMEVNLGFDGNQCQIMEGWGTGVCAAVSRFNY